MPTRPGTSLQARRDADREAGQRFTLPAQGDDGERQQEKFDELDFAADDRLEQRKLVEPQADNGDPRDVRPGRRYRHEDL